MRYGLYVLCTLFLIGCENKISQNHVVAKVGSYVISQEEFEEAYQNSAQAVDNNADSRQLFLKNMINQKLILLSAQAQGLDKDKKFLKMLESFWQQSLLTVALQQKSKEGVNLDQWVDSLRKNTKIEINQEY